MTESYKPKLIEVALPLAAISDASAREKSVKRGKPSSIHLWWARRPFVSARAVLWASLVDDPSARPAEFPTASSQQAERERLFEILERLSQWENSNDRRVIEEATREILRCSPDGLPTIVDPFGGGGTLPLESLRLGLPTISGDLNPVATLIQRATLELPYRFGSIPTVHPSSERMTASSARHAIAEDLLRYGEDLRTLAHEKLSHAYPEVATADGRLLTPIAWLWARTVQSPDPSWPAPVPLVGSWILRSKAPKVWVRPSVDHVSKTISYEIVEGGTPRAGTVERSGAECIATGTPIPFSYIRAEGMAGRIGSQLLAIVAEGDRKRVYLPPDAMHEAAAGSVTANWRPESQLQGKARQNVSLYGLDRFDQLFTERQLACLSTLSDCLPEMHRVIQADAVQAGLEDDSRRFRDGGFGATAYADALVTYLGFAIDRLADWNNSLCRWENKAQVPQQLFGRHSMPMVWDYAEANTFSSSTGSLSATIKTISSSISALPPGEEATVHQMDAAALVESVGASVILTDPPYYANINYAELADFFFVWLRRGLRDIWPDECATLLTPKDDEIIANYFRADSKSDANHHFEKNIKRVFEAVARNQIHDIPAAIFYAFKQSEESDAGQTSTGWETFLQGILDAGLAVTATWPIRTENRSRLMASGTNALASSIVLACRPRQDKASLETRGGFVQALRSELPEALAVLQRENIAPVDLAQSAIGPGMRIFSRYARVVEADGSVMRVRAALGLINEILGEVLSAEEAELDPDSRFALTWFEQYGHGPGPYGDADVLARAKDTSVDGVVQAGIAVSRAGKVRLLERSELAGDWSPKDDRRATVWEATQYLVRRLGDSESDAAALLADLGGLADRSRQLAYLLYGVCERKNLTEDAISYNGLITAWPELVRLALAPRDRPGQQSLLGEA